MITYVCIHVFTFAATSVFKDLKSEAREVEWPWQGHKWQRQASYPGLLTPGPLFLPPACTALPTAQIFRPFHAFLCYATNLLQCSHMSFGA